MGPSVRSTAIGHEEVLEKPRTRWPRAGELSQQKGCRANGVICSVRKVSHAMAPADQHIWNDTSASNWESKEQATTSEAGVRARRPPGVGSLPSGL